MVKQFTIVLEQERGPFSPGSVVRGSVIVEVEEPKKYDEIVVFVTGEGEVSWSRGTAEHAVQHSSRETYVSLQSTPWTKNQTEDGMLPKGYHSFPFQFTLPSSCPSSFKCLLEGAHIIYRLDAVIRTGSLKFNHEVSLEFLVVERVHINTALSEPVRKEHREKTGYLCCTSGEVTITAELSGSRFVVGEEVRVDVHIENGSNRAVTPRCELVENVMMFAERDTNWTVVSLLEHIGDAVPPHSTSPVRSLRLVLPHDIVPALTTSIIKSSHAVKVTLEMPFSFNPQLLLPIIISNA